MAGLGAVGRTPSAPKGTEETFNRRRRICRPSQNALAVIGAVLRYGRIIFAHFDSDAVLKVTRNSAFLANRRVPFAGFLLLADRISPSLFRFLGLFLFSCCCFACFVCFAKLSCACFGSLYLFRSGLWKMLKLSPTPPGKKQHKYDHYGHNGRVAFQWWRNVHDSPLVQYPAPYSWPDWEPRVGMQGIVLCSRQDATC